MRLICTENKNKKAESAAYLLKKYAKNSDGETILSVSFFEDKNCVGDGYRFERRGEDIFVFGNTAVAFNAAVGYLVRHQSIGIEDSKSVSFDSDFRAVYFANHFYNYYHAAPVDELCEYIESLALWGQSALSLWFDMHHFKSIDDFEAKKMLDRMLCLFKKARQLGMKTALTRLPNEYYAGAAPELLAENVIRPERYNKKLCGFYYTELCPSTEEGKDLLLSSFDELMERFSPVGIDYILMWPYDQGGCTCEKCYPWGSNGFFDLAKEQAKIAKKHFPDIEIIFSCWRFDAFTDGEWESVIPRIKNEGDWIDKLMVDINSELPEELLTLNKTLTSFPEISMYRAIPWGGFGANPFPMALQRKFRGVGKVCHGGALYSEGIFEDINKAVALELMRDVQTDPRQTVFEYCAYHFGYEYAEALTDVILRLEETLRRGTYLANGERNDYPSGKPEALYKYVIEDASDVESIATKLLEIDEMLPTVVKESPRYQLIRIRALGDAALLGNGGVPSEKSDAIFLPLIDIYHAQKAYYFVAPVTRESIMENRGEGV